MPIAAKQRYTQQTSQNLALAFTFSMPGSMTGTQIEVVDLHSGESVRPFFEGWQSYRINDAKTGHLIATSNQLLQADSLLRPTATSVAAAAYDAIHNRLFYTPLGINQLRYIDLTEGATLVFNYVNGQEFGTSKGISDIPGQITRMVIDAKGIGYALSNDANHLIRFTTGKNPQITDLGGLIDATRNVTFSVHSSCSSPGGDMVSDINGTLYLVTAYNHVFTIDVNTRIATYKGMITGLPPGFTSNGAAVDDEGELIVSCAMPIPANAYYRIDMNNLTAMKLINSGAVINAADLANGNILGQKAKAKGLFFNTNEPQNPDGRGLGVYPNPAKGDFLNITLSNFARGAYELQIEDITGRALVNRSVNIVSEAQQVERVNINSITGQGLYVVRLSDRPGTMAYSRQFIIIRD